MAYIGKQPVVGNFVKLDAITTSATATYNLLNGGVAYFPQTANNCIVSLNGVIQSPTSAYTISGSTIVFSDALTASDSIDFILVLGDVLNIGTPSDATVGFAKVTSNLITGATAETSIAGGDSVLIYDDSAAALRKMTRTNFVSGLGGLTEADMFRQTSNGTSDTVEATITGMTRVNSDGFDKIGTGMSESSGIFTFPSTGIYLINFSVNYLFDSSASTENYIYTTLDNSNYNVATNTRISGVADRNNGGSGFFIFDVTSTANCKVKFNTYATASITRRGGSDFNTTYVTFIKLGET
jgi:hypothetical protein